MSTPEIVCWAFALVSIGVASAIVYAALVMAGRE